MIVGDTSWLPMPGKHTEAIAALQDLRAYIAHTWPPASPTQLWVETTGELGRIHYVVQRESLAEFERVQTAMDADAPYQALAQKVAPLILPGSVRRSHLRTV